MEIGIIGRPGCGKTTLFNALTGSTAPTHSGGGRAEPNVAIVNVPDERIERLCALFNPKKIVHATVRYVDIPGQAVEAGGKQEGLSEAALNQLATTDMLLAVIRNFSGASGLPVDPAGEAAALDLDLTISDLAKVENRLPRLELSLKKMSGRERDRLVLEQQALERVRGPLEQGTPLRTLEFTPEEKASLRGFAFLTQKPILYLLNCEDPAAAASPEALAPLGERAAMPRTACAARAGQIEQEIAQLSPADREVFLADYGIRESASGRIIRLCYDLLGYISFFTCGPKEVHAWTLSSGLAAPQAAGVIHSDFERGFIRAEVTPCDALLREGSFKACRDKALLRTEGKTYIVQDGDVVEFLFSV